MNPADILKYGHLTVTRSLEGLPDSAWQTGGVCGVWSVQDIIAHLASYERMLEEVLAPFASMKIETPMMNRIGQIGIGAFNDDQVEARRHLSKAEAWDEYEQSYLRISEQFVPKIAAEVWSQTGTLPWYGAEYSLDDYIVYTYYGHKREHCAQINSFKDTLRAT